jgi:DNA-binding response OmpR family regulator
MANRPASKPARILVIEDEGDILEVLKLLLEYEGHRVSTAKDGRTALAAAAAHSFDLVVMDISMPDMSGIEVARALRADAKTADVRIAFHTGLDEHWVRERFADYDLYLTKANDAEVLVEEIAGLLARTRSARPGGATAATVQEFSAKDVLRARHALHKAMGVETTALSLDDFLAVVAAEIAQLRKIGRSDAEIAALIGAAIGRDLPATALAHRPRTTLPRG